MIENYNLFLLVCGIAFLFGALFPIIFKRTPISLPMLQVGFGLLMGYWWTSLSFLNPIDNGLIIEKLTEIVVLVSLVGAGIKIDTELSWHLWRPTVRLLLITMSIGTFCNGSLRLLCFWFDAGRCHLARRYTGPDLPRPTLHTT